MTVRIDNLTPSEVTFLVGRMGYNELDLVQRQIFLRCLQASSEVWAGHIDSDLACVWGVCPPTLLSDRAYLWLWTSPAVKGNEFIFIRHSQRVVEALLEEFPILYGKVIATAEESKRWLKLLGAKFLEPEDNLSIPFQIRKKKWK